MATVDLRDEMLTEACEIIAAATYGGWERQAAKDWMNKYRKAKGVDWVYPSEGPELSQNAALIRRVERLGLALEFVAEKTTDPNLREFVKGVLSIKEEPDSVG